jgi:nitrous oxidase accessory protein
MRRVPFRFQRPALLGVVLSLFGLAAPAGARDVRVAAREGALAMALAQAGAGDTLTLAPGTHHGVWPVRVPITLRGESGAVLDGGGRGSVLVIAAAGTVVQDLEIRGSGRRVLTVDSGLRVIAASDVTLMRVRFRDVLYGVSVERSDRLRVESCDLEGRVPPLDESGEGNGIHLWYCHDATLENNRSTHFTDGVYLSFADDSRVRGNHLHHNGRYGLHTMYCQRTRLLENVFDHNVAGIAIMFSNGLEVERNLMIHNRGPRTYGLLLRDCSGGSFRDNRLVDNTVGIFMDNSNRNRIEKNLLQDDGWGVILFSSCAGNQFALNDFVNDDYPLALDMRRTSNRFDDGRRGNYWSGSAPYDLDGDGVSDVPYSPVSAFAFVSKQYPDLALLAKSPAVAALAVAERVFPSLRPSEAVDSFPAVRPVAGLAALARESGAPRRSTGALMFFAVLLLLGLTGLVRGRLAS